MQELKDELFASETLPHAVEGRRCWGCASLAHLDLSEMEGKISAAAYTTSTSTDTRTRTVEAVMKIVTELRKKHQPRVDSSTDRVSTVGLVLEAGCHISAVCS